MIATAIAAAIPTRIIPAGDNYPGLVGWKADNGVETVVYGTADPEEAQRVVEARDGGE